MQYLNSIIEESRLSRREMRIARMRANDKSVKQIADRLNISETTVNTHLKHIYAKLDIHSLAQLINWVYMRDRLHSTALSRLAEAFRLAAIPQKPPKPSLYVN